MTNEQITKWIADLDSKGVPFLKEYAALCLKHGMRIEDSMGGDCMVAAATEKEIEKHIESLLKTMESDLRIYRSTLVCGRFGKIPGTYE